MDLNWSSVAEGHSHNEPEINSTPLYTYEIYLKTGRFIKKIRRFFLTNTPTFYLSNDDIEWQVYLNDNCFYDKCFYDKCTLYDKCTFMTTVFMTNVFMTSVPFMTNVPLWQLFLWQMILWQVYPLWQVIYEKRAYEKWFYDKYYWALFMSDVFFMWFWCIFCIFLKKIKHIFN